VLWLHKVPLRTGTSESDDENNRLKRFGHVEQQDEKDYSQMLYDVGKVTELNAEDDSKRNGVIV